MNNVLLLFSVVASFWLLPRALYFYFGFNKCGCTKLCEEGRKFCFS